MNKIIIVAAAIVAVFFTVTHVHAHPRHARAVVAMSHFTAPSAPPVEAAPPVITVPELTVYAKAPHARAQTHAAKAQTSGASSVGRGASSVGRGASSVGRVCDPMGPSATHYSRPLDGGSGGFVTVYECK